MTASEIISGYFTERDIRSGVRVNTFQRTSVPVGLSSHRNTVPASLKTTNQLHIKCHMLPDNSS